MRDFIIISDSFLYKSCELSINTYFMSMISESNLIRLARKYKQEGNGR